MLSRFPSLLSEEAEVMGAGGGGETVAGPDAGVGLRGPAERGLGESVKSR